MSETYVDKINNTPIAASEVAPNSALSTTISGKQDSLGLNPTSGDVTKFLNEKGQFSSTPGSLDRWWDSTGFFNTTSTTGGVWGKLATITYPDGLDGQNVVYGQIWMHQYGTAEVHASYSIFFPEGSASQCQGNFTASNINNIKLGYVVDTTNRTVDLYGYLYNYQYSGIKLQVEKMVRYHGTDVQATVTYYPGNQKTTTEPTGITYAPNNIAQVVNTFPDENGIIAQHGVSGKPVSITCKRTDTNSGSGTAVALEVGSGGINHGIWSFALNKWMMYGDASRVYLNGAAYGYEVDTYNNSTMRVELGYCTVDTVHKEANYSAIVNLYSVSGPGDTGRSISILVSISCRGTVRTIRGTILNDNEWSTNNRPVILTDMSDSDTRMHVYIGIADINKTLMTFSWTRTKVIPVGTTLNWTTVLSHDSTTTYATIRSCYSPAPVTVLTGPSDNVHPFIKFVCTNTGTAKGFAHFKCVFMGINNDDGMGQVDITIKIRQNTWHGLALKCVRIGGAGSTSYSNTGNMIYWQTTIDGKPVFYIGLRPSSWNDRVSVYEQECDLNGTATYRIGDFYSEISGLTATEGDNRDVSKSLCAVKAEGIVDAGQTSRTLTLDWNNEIAKISPYAPSTTTRSHTRWITGAYTGGKFETCDATNVTVGASTAVCDSNDKRLGFEYNPSGITGGSPASECKTYWSNLTVTGKWVYNNAGNEFAMLFNKAGNYGTVVRWGYYKPYLEMLRCWSSNWRTDEWEPIAQPSILCFTYTDTSAGMESLFKDLCNSINHTVGDSSTSTRYDLTVLYRGGYFYPLVYFNKAGSGGNYQYTWRFANTGVYGINMITQMVFTVIVPASGTTTYSWSTESETRWKQQVGSIGTDSQTIYFT